MDNERTIALKRFARFWNGFATLALIIGIIGFLISFGLAVSAESVKPVIFGVAGLVISVVYFQICATVAAICSAIEHLPDAKDNHALFLKHVRKWRSEHPDDDDME